MKRHSYCGHLLFVITLLIFYDCSKEKNVISNSPITDIDGNVYHSVTIGSQIWMVENLKTTKYNDGTPIENAQDNWNEAWTNSIGAYCWYQNDNHNKNTYGALYNWYAVNSGKLCPKGWHVPSYNEWSVLKEYLGGMEETGGILKESGTSHWNSPNSNATNKVGFKALPGGTRFIDGDFDLLGFQGNWWTSTEFDDYEKREAWYETLNNETGTIFNDFYYKGEGHSVRCIKD